MSTIRTRDAYKTPSLLLFLRTRLFERFFFSLLRRQHSILQSTRQMAICLFALCMSHCSQVMPCNGVGAGWIPRPFGLVWLDPRCYRQTGASLKV